MYLGEIIFGLHAYELFLIIGMLIAIFLADRMAIKAGFSLSLQRQLLISVIVALVFGVFGAALFQGFYHFLATGLFSLESGLTFYGGFIVGVGAFLIMWFLLTKPLKLSDEAKQYFPCVANMAAVLIPMAHAFGRIGCLFEGCCHGKITDAWYGVPHYDVCVGDVCYDKARVVPIQLFEAIFLFALAGVLLWLYLRGAKRGQSKRQTPLFPSYMIAYGIWRFIIEFFRADERGETIVPFFTPSQLIAVLLVIGGIICFLTWYFTRKRGKITEMGAKADNLEQNKEYTDDENRRDAGV